MSIHNKEVISEKTLIIWMVWSVVSSIACLLITAVAVYILYDCWIMFQHQLAGGRCSTSLNKGIVFSVPLVFGIIIGTVLTRKSIKANATT